MAYKKEHIDKVDKKGLFDSTLDPSILAMDNHEKKKLAKKLKNKQEQEQLKNTESQSFNTKEFDHNADVSNDEELKLWERVMFFIQKLLFGVSEEEFIKTRKLHKISLTVKRYRPALFNFHTHCFTNHFGLKFYHLAAQLSGFKEVYQVCNFKNDKMVKINQMFVDYLIKNLVDDFPSIEEKFSYKYVKDNLNLFSEKNIKNTLDKEINQSLSEISFEVRQEINRYYTNIISYARLAEFNFVKILRKFGDNFTESNGDVSEFAPVKAESIIDDIKKLEDMIYTIDFSVDMSRPFELIVDFYNSLNEEDNNKRASVWRNEDFIKLDEYIRTFTDEERLTNLIRIITEEPAHMPKLRRRQINLLEDYRLVLLEYLLPLCRELVYRVETDELNLKIKGLFGSNPLSDIDFYNDSTNKRLSGMNLPIFTNCKYLQIIKTYYERLFEPLIKPALNVVVVDGDFFDKHLYSQLSDYFYKFSDVYIGIIDFEKKFSSASKDGSKLIDMFTHYSGDLPTKKVLTEKIHYFNHLSAKAIKGIAELICIAVPALNAIVKDSQKMQKPNFVLNIKQLGGIRNRAIIKTVQKAAEATELLNQIIKNFL